MAWDLGHVLISLLKLWKTVRLVVQYDVYLNTWVITFLYLYVVVYFQVRLAIGGDFVCSELIVRFKIYASI